MEATLLLSIVQGLELDKYVGGYGDDPIPYSRNIKWVIAMDDLDHAHIYTWGSHGAKFWNDEIQRRFGGAMAPSLTVAPSVKRLIYQLDGLDVGPGRSSTPAKIYG